MIQENWKVRADRKRAERDGGIPKEWLLPSKITDTVREDATISVTDIPRTCGILTAKEVDITENHDAVDLVKKMAAKELTAVEVTQAFCKRAAIAQQLTRCLTEVFFDQAMERAKYLDQHLEREGKPLGPLHGIPISVKVISNLHLSQSVTPIDDNKGLPECEGHIFDHRLCQLHWPPPSRFQLSTR
jgi:amidase